MTMIDSATRAMPSSMVGPMPTDGFHRAVNSQPLHDAVQGHRDDDTLESQGEHGGRVQMRRLLHVGLPGDGH